jgi:hypothetical protein
MTTLMHINTIHKILRNAFGKYGYRIVSGDIEIYGPVPFEPGIVDFWLYGWVGDAETERKLMSGNFNA